jgi:hypothetical protein
MAAEASASDGTGVSDSVIVTARGGCSLLDFLATPFWAMQKGVLYTCSLLELPQQSILPIFSTGMWKEGNNPS